MTLLRRLSDASVVATFILISIGGLVRATKSGLGCGTDWPHCGGRLVPALETRAEIIEFSHRAAASVVVALLATVLVVAFRNHRNDRRVVGTAAAAMGLVVMQAVMGAVVVKLELEASSVVLHLALALSLLALLVYLATIVRARTTDPVEAPADDGTGVRARLAAATVLVLLLVGSYVAGRGEELRAGFPDWPLVQDRLVPDLGVEILALHWLHRVLALVAGAAIIGLAVHVVRRNHDRATTAFAHAAAGLFLAEIAVGAANVWTQSDETLNSAFVTAHLALGAAIWGCVAAVAARAAATLRRAHEKRPVVREASVGAGG